MRTTRFSERPSPHHPRVLSKIRDGPPLRHPVSRSVHSPSGDAGPSEKSLQTWPVPMFRLTTEWTPDHKWRRYQFKGATCQRVEIQSLSRKHNFKPNPHAKPPIFDYGVRSTSQRSSLLGKAAARRLRRMPGITRLCWARRDSQTDQSELRSIEST